MAQVQIVEQVSGLESSHTIDDSCLIAGIERTKGNDQTIAPSSTKSSAQERYRHTAVVHNRSRTSCLSHESSVAPSFLGFRNLMVIVIIVMNLRLVVENFMKYGVLICIRCHDYRRQDLILAGILYALVPCHLFVAYIIELVAAQHAKGAVGRRKRKDSHLPDSQLDKQGRVYDSTWRNIAIAHTLNATLCLFVTTITVYGYINHPLIGTICQFHAIIVWLKNSSYALTNRDLRHALLHSNSVVTLPDLYSSCPYPRNVTFGNLSYFWWAPTLVYQPVYPRSSGIRWIFISKRLGEAVGLSVFIWLASAQYASPVLKNSLDVMASLNLASIVERLMKLSTISLVIWLAGFFAIFQSLLNALAEIMHFADREFYTDWWNSPSVGAYWRTWNKPMNHFMRRHIYSPLIGRGWSTASASIMVFVLSRFLHELLVGIPTHNVTGIAFVGMIVQIPMIHLTLPLEKKQGINGKIIGNCIFWVSFCLVGQPLAALLYYFAWQAKYGSVSRVSSISNSQSIQ